MNALQKVKNDFSYNRQSAQQKAKAALDFALQNEDFNKLYKAEKELTISIAKKEFSGENADLLTSELAKNKLTQNEVLKTLNLNPLDLLPQYNCNICSDTGYINDKMCDCLKRATVNELSRQSGMNLNKDYTFSNTKFDLFKDKTQKDTIKKIYDKMQELTNKFPETKLKTVVISGCTGVGKTYLTQCIANSLLQRGASVYYATAFNLNSNFSKYHTTFDISRDTYLAPALTCEALFIDDLGTEPILKNVTLEYLWLVLNERIQNGLFTFINTNLQTEELRNRYGDRIFSRLMNKSASAILRIEGEDLRLKRT